MSNSRYIPRDIDHAYITELTTLYYITLTSPSEHLPPYKITSSVFLVEGRSLLNSHFLVYTC